MENFEKTLSPETLDQKIARQSQEIQAELNSIGGEENLDKESKALLAKIREGEAALAAAK
ncbi:MAG TPA: hypothetical protein VGE18_02955 [Candidatus Paceibacterota bacterium]